MGNELSIIDEEISFDLTEPGETPFGAVDLSQIEFLVQPDEWIGVETLRSMYHPSNSQVRDPNELVAIQRSLKKNGMAGALIVVNRWNKKVLGGHGKIEAAYQGGYRGDLPVVYMDIPSETDHRLRMLQLNMATGHQDEDLQRREVQYLLDLLPATEVLPDLALSDDDLAQLLNLAGSEDGDEVEGDGDLIEGNKDRPSLADRFIIPPFSVLDARQGYWQDRKRSWIALGIQSELGRGEEMTWQGEAVADPGLNYDSNLSRDRPQKVSPGGSPRDAATLGKNGKTIRGDGSGKPLKQVGGGKPSEHGNAQ